MNLARSVDLFFQKKKINKKIKKINGKNYLFSWQLFRLNSAGQLGVGERCVNADSQGVKLVVCRLGTVDGPWEYDEVKILGGKYK